MDMRGRWHRWQKKGLVGSYWALDMARITKYIDLEQPGSYIWTWTRTGDSNAAQIAVEVIVGQGLCLRYTHAGVSIDPYLIPVVTTQPHFGGARSWFLCPSKKCQKRVRVLYAGKFFLCRHCHNLTYASAQTGGKLIPSLESRLTFLRRRLSANGGLSEGLPDRPPGMHARTYVHLANEYMKLLQLRELALAYELFDLIRVFDLAGELPLLPEDMKHRLMQEWKAYKAQRA